MLAILLDVRDTTMKMKNAILEHTTLKSPERLINKHVYGKK